ncbi:glycosyltransferase [Croceicoccus mobilis]|uniref:Glycosyl transferase n=1 Tax=Croceicoccus mobilis TaxID=1703339 RepID=A0A916Z1X6_9SPHN|nr:glycosyltransferase [Croceicoccus mobilis]GGD72169.1 glycosyl transferase [Croceicoccus mobilis]
MNAVHPLNLHTSEAPRARFSEPRVAIVHYWLVSMRGGERVLERLLRLFPQADVFTNVYDPSKMSNAINEAKVTTSFINKMPMARRWYQYYLPLMPMALEQFDLNGYDLIISSESGPAKGVITDPTSHHMCYCHSPMRYLWDHYHQYRNGANVVARAAMPMLYHKLRQWDVASSTRVDNFVANSNFIRQRILKHWRREADVVHPPVETNLFTPSTEVDDHYLWVGQMVPYKRPDLAVEAFNMSGKPLMMVGTGGMEKHLKKIAKPNIKFVDRLNFDDLRRAYARARALVFTAEEDFGIVPVEAMASGRPVLAYGRGGILDSVLPEQTGIFFPRQTPESLADGIAEMERWLPHFDPSVAVRRAQVFAPERFDSQIRSLTEQYSA